MNYIHTKIHHLLRRDGFKVIFNFRCKGTTFFSHMQIFLQK